VHAIGKSASFVVCSAFLVATFVAGGTTPSYAQLLVPGTGQKVEEVGDDFEDPEWSYIFNLPKSSSNIDQQPRWPAGESANGRWEESHYRGQPDVIRRIPTPEGGLPGSQGALLLRSLNTGIPGRVTNKMQQDDLLLNIGTKLGYIPVSSSPSCVVRVFLPPFEYWEPRTGTSFGLRADLTTTTVSGGGGGFFSRRAPTRKMESYWPGIFIQFNSKADTQNDKDSAVLLIRANESGHEITGPTITETGWWTLGMSFTPDGRVHYFARQGVGDLTPADHIVSSYPYGYRAENFSTFFFNIVNMDDGRTWSTEWVIDDPTLYLLRR
jgi:hypothetical protein